MEMAQAEVSWLLRINSPYQECGRCQQHSWAQLQAPEGILGLLPSPAQHRNGISFIQ